MLREVSSHHEIHLMKFQQKARLPFFESAQLVDFFGVGIGDVFGAANNVAKLGLFPQVSAAKSPSIL